MNSTCPGDGRCGQTVCDHEAPRCPRCGGAAHTCPAPIVATGLGGGAAARAVEGVPASRPNLRKAVLALALLAAMPHRSVDEPPLVSVAEPPLVDVLPREPPAAPEPTPSWVKRGRRKR